MIWFHLLLLPQGFLSRVDESEFEVTNLIVDAVSSRCAHVTFTAKYPEYSIDSSLTFGDQVKVSAYVSRDPHGEGTSVHSSREGTARKLVASGVSAHVYQPDIVDDETQVEWYDRVIRWVSQYFDRKRMVAGASDSEVSERMHGLHKQRVFPATEWTNFQAVIPDIPRNSKHLSMYLSDSRSFVPQRTGEKSKRLNEDDDEQSLGAWSDTFDSLDDATAAPKKISVSVHRSDLRHGFNQPESFHAPVKTGQRVDGSAGTNLGRPTGGKVDRSSGSNVLASSVCVDVHWDVTESPMRPEASVSGMRFELTYRYPSDVADPICVCCSQTQTGRNDSGSQNSKFQYTSLSVNSGECGQLLMRSDRTSSGEQRATSLDHPDAPGGRASISGLSLDRFRTVCGLRPSSEVEFSVKGQTCDGYTQQSSVVKIVTPPTAPDASASRLSDKITAEESLVIEIVPPSSAPKENIRGFAIYLHVGVINAVHFLCWVPTDDAVKPVKFPLRHVSRGLSQLGDTQAPVSETALSEKPSSLQSSKSLSQSLAVTALMNNGLESPANIVSIPPAYYIDVEGIQCASHIPNHIQL